MGDVIGKPKAIVVDLQGTSLDKSFFKNTLLPYAKSNMEKYLDREWEKPEIIAAVNELRINSRARMEKDQDSPEVASKSESREVIMRSVVSYMKHSFKNDFYSDEVLLILYHLWIFGYKRKELESQVYPDVADSFKDWKQKQIKIYTISGGRKEAQTLVFAKTASGSLLQYIDGHFDSTIGKKTDISTYEAMARQIQENSKDILFLTDSYIEARVAKQAGINVVMVSRPGNSPIPSEITKKNDFKIISTFLDIKFK